MRAVRITCPSPTAKHGGRFGMQILVDRAFTKNFHAQFSLPHFMTRLAHSGYQLTFWAKTTRSASPEVMAEVVFLDVDEADNKQAKPAAARLDRLWKEEW